MASATCRCPSRRLVHGWEVDNTRRQPHDVTRGSTGHACLSCWASALSCSGLFSCFLSVCPNLSPNRLPDDPPSSLQQRPPPPGGAGMLPIHHLLLAHHLHHLVDIFPSVVFLCQFSHNLTPLTAANRLVSWCAPYLLLSGRAGSWMEGDVTKFVIIHTGLLHGRPGWKKNSLSKKRWNI